MHFAYPSRKSSNPPPFRPRSSRIPILRRSRLQTIALAGLAIIFLVWLFSGSGSGSTSSSSAYGLTSSGGSKSRPSRTITGKPPVVIVTVFDEQSSDMSPDVIRSIKANREQYAQKHGYKTHLVSARAYDLGTAPTSWAKVPAVRHALAIYPDCKYVWFLEQNAVITNPALRVEDYIMGENEIEKNMIRDHSVVPPDSIIKTFSHLKGKDIDFVVTQDREGLGTGSFVVRNGEWAKFFLDTWFDPLYRSYNFQKAETHALEHIVQWHPTILSKLAIIPQRLLSSYSNPRQPGDMYREGDLAVVFRGCSKGAADGSCTAEAKRFLSRS
ncbi:galactosyl transferase GMA12/MNN10 family-domain-containing protein [Xylariales sp. PMI_506]|nr:galactosyl transferase GMA12/MNN10 family-domain-containing protein [Xylariales sp. PMI_506]